MRFPRPVMLAAALAALGVLAAACGGGTSSSDKTATARAGSASPARATTPASGGAAATNPTGVTLDITARDFEFNPKTAKGEKGKSVTINFKNEGAVAHTLTLYSDDAHTKRVAGGDTGTVSAGGSKTLTIPASEATGDLYFRCEIHPTQMTGEVSIA